MPSIQETIPDHLAEAAEAARAWFSADQGSEFKLTGIVDPVELAEGPLQLILCGHQKGQEVCLRERFGVRSVGAGFEIDHLEGAPPEYGSVAPLLDPPAGERRGWIDQVTARHEFTVLIFYRGFW